MWQFALGVLAGIILVVGAFVIAVTILVLWLSRHPKERPTTIDLMTYPISHVIVERNPTTPSKISNLQEERERRDFTL